MMKLKKELEAQAMQHEQSVSSMRTKQNQALQELQEEIDGLKKAKSKYVTHPLNNCQFRKLMGFFAWKKNYLDEKTRTFTAPARSVT